LALYDIVIYADDSTSMKYAESGARIDDMKVILERVTEVATLFDDDGMSNSLSTPMLTMLCIACVLHLTRSCLDFLCCDGFAHVQKYLTLPKTAW